jgi:hypothetical protein
VSSLSLIKNYSDTVDPRILMQYKSADRFLFVNTDDKDLEPIRIDLPSPPEYHEIDGFGLPAKDQIFTPPKVPRRLKELQKKLNTIDEIWEVLENNQDIYEDEIKFINDAWFHRLYGYWFFNNGKPTYIDGWHYFFCSWWSIDVGLPEYRSRDRKFFLFARMTYNETHTFKDIDKKGNAIISEETGYYDFLDTGSRVLYGFNYPKHRREGATYKAQCIGYEILSRTENASGGIQSQNDNQAKDCFLKHLIAPWKKLPFFFKPTYEGSTSPKTELSFSPPAKRLSSKGSLAKSEEGLGSKIDFTNAEAGAYDGWKMYYHHDDEVGKLKGGISCWARHLVVKECLQQGAGKNIIGFTIKTSTVGEMERGGGKAFQTQCELSDYFIRTPNGQTVSGLATLFIPAYDGLEGFIDRYGNSVIDTPTKEQSAYINSKIGAKEHLLNNRKGFIDSANYEGLSEETRKYPMSFTECFRTSAKDSGFNMQKLETYIDELRFNRSSAPVEGDFRWINNAKDTKVEFIARKGGKFKVSHQLNEGESNRKFWDEETFSWKPGNTSWGVAGADPFKFNKTAGNRKSKGGGSVVRKGKMKDGDFSMKRKFVCTYSHRTYDKALYAEDMLMMSVYYGVQMFPEINVDLIWDYFEQRGYSAFLLYRVDPKTFQQNKTPGANTNEKLKQDIFTEFMGFIESEADEENHIELLEECRDIAGIEEMTNYDLFTAAGYALLGTAGIYNEIEELDKQEIDLGAFYKKRTYKR